MKRAQFAGGSGRDVGRGSGVSGRSAGLRVKGLTVPDGSRWLVRDLDFEVKPGTVHMVLGERDTGKTALLETLAGLRREERGTVRLGDDDASLRDRRRGTRSAWGSRLFSTSRSRPCVRSSGDCSSSPRRSANPPAPCFSMSRRASWVPMRHGIYWR
ncbi:MAG: ATP-binding cassette domain-containing protein [Candidatus Eisenbacteria bacterium]|uniref:ATP-binding cassette domain-containing protein n=1 Tax=Eiseniibacteriota bacterium TaxID=2212470 RepID=A0A538SLT4_UNCEI|nr:MAG: ATP-binding cassette domain-containing protein [Candidatus Eisenbacteria bacterium]